MFDIQNYASFVTAIILFQVIPGPGTLAILGATARSGVGAGMGAVCGTLLGDFIYMLAAVLGVAALLAANPMLFSVMQWAGIAYLCRIGWKLLRTAAGNEAVSTVCGMSNRQFFRQAFLVSITNPKVIMFFMAFFPLFMTVDARPATLLAMMLHVTAISLFYQTVLVLAGDAVARRLSRIRHVRLLATRLAGAALIGFGVKMAIGNR